MSLKKLGRYDLIRVLGKGAMGLVYEGRDPNLDRRVAIKTIKVENLSEEDAAEYEVRFRTEARSAARLQHPHIVSVYDAGRDGDIAFLVMEFIQGDDLKHYLDKGDLYTLAQTLGIMGDLLSALDYAHGQKIVHRDIKPANLLIEASGRVKLTDFGVARIQDSSDATRTQGTMVGTLKYMSPEQVQGRLIDARADLFAAGIVLYQLLTGKRPFDGDTDFAIIQQIVGQTPAAPTSFNPKLPSAIDAVVARALAKSPGQRFATAHEFSQALQAATREATKPTMVPPASSPRSGSSPTWTATLRPGEALVGLQSGTSTDIPIVTQELELVYWKEIKDSTEAEDIQDFLVKFPAGIYASLARRRLRKLGVLAGEDSDIGLRSDTGMLTTPLSATRMDKTVLMPRDGPSGTPDTTPDHADMISGATEGAAVQTSWPPPVQGDDTVPARVAKAAPPAPASSRLAWAAAGIVVLAAGIGFKLVAGSGVPPAAPAPVVQATAVQSAAPAAVEAAPAAVKTPANDKGRLAQQARAKTAARAAPASPPTRDADTGPAPVAPANPRQACEGRNRVTFQICIAVQCARPSFADHPICAERRALEQRKQEAEQSLR